MQNGMLIVCVTDMENQCRAVFEVKDRKQATAVRRLLYFLLPHDCHSSVATWVETKQHYVERTATTSQKIGLPLAPIKWFGNGGKLPERLEDLLVSPEVLQSCREERDEQMRKKPLSYWGLPIIL